MGEITWNVGKLYWTVSLAPLMNAPAPPPPPKQAGGLSKDAEAVLAVIPGYPGASVEEIRKRVRKQPGADFIPDIQKVLDELEKAHKVGVASGPLIRGGKAYWK
jgi:hypothetical protein